MPLRAGREERLEVFVFRGGPDGFPLSWQHYKYGLQHIARDNMRQQLWMAQSFRLGRQKDENWEVFQRDTNRLTEVPTHG